MLTKSDVICRVKEKANKTDAKIDKIEIYLVTTHYYKPFEIATAISEKEDTIVYIIHTDGGTIGIGDGVVPKSQSKEELLQRIDALSKKIIKMPLKDVFEVYVEEFAKEDRYVKIPISLALLDAISREAGLRFGNLFDKICKEKVFTDVTVGIEPLGETLEDVKKALNQGFKAIKLKVGKGGASVDFERIKRVYEILPDDVALRIDANQGWTFEQALEIVEKMKREEVYVDIIEQPFPRDKLSWFEKFRSISEFPVIADESAMTSADLEKLQGKVDGVNLKLWKAGDPIEVYFTGRRARELGMRVMIGCAGETNIGITADTYLASIIPVDYADLDSDLLKEDVVSQKATGIRSSFRILPKRSGLGIELVMLSKISDKDLVARITGQVI